MSDRVYKITEVVGTSEKSIEDAIEGAIKRTCSTVDHVEWFQVTDTRGHIENGRVAHYQVVLKVGFRMER